MSAPSLSYATLFVDDPGRTVDRYRRALGCDEGPSLRPDQFRRLRLDGTTDLTFCAQPVRQALELPDDAAGYLTLDPGDAGGVGRLADALVAEGAHLVKPPYETHYGTVLAVLVDPDGHAVRIEHPRLPETR